MAHRKNRFQTGIIATLFLLGNAMPMAAQTIVDGGAVDYNMGAEGLYNMTEFLLVDEQSGRRYFQEHSKPLWCLSFPTDSHLRIPRILRYSEV